MTEALIVNPHDEDSVADALSRAILMPLGERQEHWRALMQKLTLHNVHVWRAEYLVALQRPVPVD
jgi:trehalose 6-phosphate synthase